MWLDLNIDPYIGNFPEITSMISSSFHKVSLKPGRVVPEWFNSGVGISSEPPQNYTKYSQVSFWQRGETLFLGSKFKADQSGELALARLPLAGLGWLGVSCGPGISGYLIM